MITRRVNLIRKKVLTLATNVANRGIMPKIVEFSALNHIMRRTRRKRFLLPLGVMRRKMMRPRKKSTLLSWLKTPTQVMRRIMR